MLEAVHLEAGYPSKRVVEDFNARFEEGKLYILIGRNGSGKSTLLNTLGGWLKPLGGLVSINGNDLSRLSSKELARLSGRLASDLNNSLLVKRFVLMGSYSRQNWIDPYSQSDRKAAGMAMRSLEIDGLADERMDRISSGQKQKAAIAQILVQNPDCLLLDEPGSSLDPAAHFELMERLVSLKSAHRILLAVIHDLDLALRYGDEILVLDQGKLVFFGSADRLVRSTVIQKVFGLAVQDWDASTRTGRIFPLSCFESSDNFAEIPSAD